MLEIVDLNQAIMVDNFIWSQSDDPRNLTHIERAAICNRYINTVWTSNRGSIDLHYANARVKISAMLYRKDVPDV